MALYTAVGRFPTRNNGMFKSFGLVGSPALIRAVTAYYAEVEAEAEAKAEAEAEAEAIEACENCEVVYIA